MYKISIIGLGYVGLPLAVEFGKNREVIGFDINQQRISELKKGIDRTLEVEEDELKSASMLSFSSNTSELKEADVHIITVPTPIDRAKSPNLNPIRSASRTVGEILKKGDIVIYESTVYPGCTEEECVPILEEKSGLKFNVDFFCGYSPERINPGDKTHRLPNIKKVTSGSTPEIADRVDELYQSIITAGTHKASSIKVAEAAKVIENAQRDLNIAFVNELSVIFSRLGIDTSEVLEAAGTKWNFLPFKPGLVGGHCIGVDPYYLTYKAELVGYRPEVILAGRRINDNMGVYICNQIVKLMVDKGVMIKGAKALIMGITFKEDCPDIRNSKVIDVIDELKSFGLNVDVFDPQADKEEVRDEYGVNLIDAIEGTYDCIVLAVAHKEFLSMDLDTFKSSNSVIFDVKGILDKSIVDKRL
ncbi:MAG: Vi polysaccharide biosynthesis UDP-N-acetylglucosamine C-6 dehydrogenase TviB [Bacteroidota bacterium]